MVRERLRNIRDNLLDRFRKPQPAPPPSSKENWVGAIDTGKSQASPPMTPATPDHQKPSTSTPPIRMGGSGSSRGVQGPVQPGVDEQVFRETGQSVQKETQPIQPQPMTPATPDHQKPVTTTTATGAIDVAEDRSLRQIASSTFLSGRSGDVRGVGRGVGAFIDTSFSRIGVGRGLQFTGDFLSEKGKEAPSLFLKGFSKLQGDRVGEPTRALAIGIETQRAGEKQLAKDVDLFTKDAQEYEIDKTSFEKDIETTGYIDLISKREKEVEEFNKFVQERGKMEDDTFVLDEKDYQKSQEKLERLDLIEKDIKRIEQEKRFTEREQKLSEKFEDLDKRQEKIKTTSTQLDKMLGPAGFFKGFSETVVTTPGRLISMGGGVIDKPVKTVTYPFREDFTQGIKEFGIGLKETAKARPYEFAGTIAGAAAISVVASKGISAAFSKGAVATKGAKVVTTSKTTAVKLPGKDATGLARYKAQTTTTVNLMRGKKVVETLSSETTSNIVAAKTKSGAVKAAVKSNAQLIEQQYVQMGLKGPQLKVKTTGSTAQGKYTITQTSKNLFKVEGQGTMQDIAKGKAKIDVTGKGKGLVKPISSEKIDFVQSGVIKKFGKTTKEVSPKGIETIKKQFASGTITDLYKKGAIKPLRTLGVGKTDLFIPKRITFTEKEILGRLKANLPPKAPAKVPFKNPVPQQIDFNKISVIKIAKGNIPSVKIGYQRPENVLKQVSTTKQLRSAAATTGEAQSNLFIAQKQAVLESQATAMNVKLASQIGQVTRYSSIAGLGVGLVSLSGSQYKTKSISDVSSALSFGLATPQMQNFKQAQVQAFKTPQISKTTTIQTVVQPGPSPSPFRPVKPGFISFGFPKMPSIPQGRLPKRDFSQQFAKAKTDYTASLGAIALGFKREVSEEEFKQLKKKKFTGLELREQVNIKNNKKKLSFW